jgi:hypothetical protein
MVNRKRTPPEVRFPKFVVRGDPLECWLWQGGLMGSGYGQFYRAPGEPVGAHRFAWEQANGRPVPSGLHVMHSCDVRRCVNPAHLSVGTASDNHWDSSRKGRNPGNRTSRGGRPRTLDVGQLQALRDAGLTYVQIGRALGVAGPTAWRNLNT